MNKQRRKPRHSLVPYTTIQAASKGDAIAIDSVLRHYGGYITRLSSRPVYDQNGRLHMRVDEVMRRRLEIKLISGILAFRAN